MEAMSILEAKFHQIDRWLDRIEIHPAGMSTIDKWMGECRHAIDNQDAASLRRRLSHIMEKIQQERQWIEEDLSFGFKGPPQ